MKVVFMGTPDFAVPVLESLVKEHEVVCVYTRAPKEAGRGHKETKTPVHLKAEALGIEVRTPKTLRNEDEQKKLEALNADVAVVAAYGLILPKAVLEAFPKGCFNTHASLLPRWRGAAPIQRAIEAGDEKSGVTIMQMDEGLDTGDMLLKGETPITPETTGGMLHDALSELGARLMAETLRSLGQIKPEKQPEDGACYAAKLEKEESHLDFTRPASELERKIRAFNPFPGTYFEYKGERFKVWEAEALDAVHGYAPATVIPNDCGLIISCGEGMLLITKIQRQGKKPMATEELLRGFDFEADTMVA